MLYNLLIFWLIFIMIFFQGTWKQNFSTKLLFLFIAGLTLALISAFRFETSGDFHTNYIGILKASNMSFKEIFFSYDEYGHMFLRKVISIFTDNPQWYFVITGFFIVGSFIVFIYRYSPNVYLSVLLYVTIGGFFTSHNITRQYIAIAICLWAIPFLVSRKIVKYLLCIFVAITFHSSAIVMIPIYFLSKIRFTRKTAILYIIVITALAFSFDMIYTYLNQFIYSESYHEGSYGTTGANILNILLPSFLLIPLFYFIRINNSCERNSQCTNNNQYIFNNLLAHMGILSFLFYFIAVTDLLILARLSNYFIVSYLIIVPTVISYMRKRNRPLIYFCTIVIILVFYFVNNFLGKLTPTPYTPFWWY